MKTILLKVITPDLIAFEGSIKMVTVKTISGYRGILPDHSPLVSLISPGKMNIHVDNDKIISYDIFNGVLIVNKKIVKILTDNIKKL